MLLVNFLLIYKVIHSNKAGWRKGSQVFFEQTNGCTYLDYFQVFIGLELLTFCLRYKITLHGTVHLTLVEVSVLETPLHAHDFL